MSNMLLEAKEIHTYYGASHILHGLDFHIREGEGIALMGRNGMGKSTLIRSLLGHVAQRDGQIHLFGRDMSRGKPHEMARLGVAYVPEGRGIFPTLTVRENLVMAARAGTAGQKDWTYERVMETFPRLSERLTNLGSHRFARQQAQVVDHARIRGDHAVLLIAGRAVGEDRRVEAVVVVAVVVLEGTDAGAQDHREVIGRAQSGGDVRAILALVLHLHNCV